MVVQDRKAILVDQIKTIVEDMVAAPAPPPYTYSVHISGLIKLNYTYMANVFSEVEGITIEHFIINKKIEAAKKLLVGETFTIGEVAAKLHYSSIGHLSNQFKKVTGINPSEFKRLSMKSTTEKTQHN